MNYDELVQKNIAGEISDLEFLLAQEELAITRTEIYTNKSWIQQVIKHYSVSPN